MRMIYQNMDYDIEEYREEYRDHLDVNDYEKEDIEKMVNDDEYVLEFIYESFNFSYDDEVANLNVAIYTDIIAIANIGRWNGRVMGYKILEGNLMEIMNSFECDSIKIYADKGNIHFTGHHHDGTNYVTFRKFKDDITDNQKDLLLNAIYTNADNVQNMIKRYTRSIYKDVAKVYGW